MEKLKAQLIETIMQSEDNHLLEILSMSINSYELAFKEDNH